MTAYKDLSKEELLELKSGLEAQFEEVKAKGLKLDMSRGKPSADQLNLSMGMMDTLTSGVDLTCEDGVDCRGYLYWGPIDVVSAGTGEMKKRYGFVYVDRFNDGHGTLERKLKDSYYRYKEIIESNGEVLLEDE